MHRGGNNVPIDTDLLYFAKTQEYVGIQLKGES